MNDRIDAKLRQRRVFMVSKKKVIIKDIKKILIDKKEILFAYIHGSFVTEEYFNDIDIGVYLKSLPSSPLEYELSLEAEFMDKIRGYIFDIRILNNAPLSFRYNVIRYGILLFARDDDLRSEFQERTVINYLDFLPYRKRYLKEVLGD